MNRLVLIFIFLLLMSACGSADDFFEELENAGVIDSILVNPSSPVDSTGRHPSDTIRVPNDSTIMPKDSTSNDEDSMKVDDSLTVAHQSEIEFTRLFTIKSKSTRSTQGFAIYGDELFNFHDANDVIDVYNMKTCKVVASIDLEPESNVHCNTVSFSNKFYSNDDKYPLIYVQQGGLENKVNVYRIQYVDSSYSAQKIQMISLSPCTHSLTAIDRDNNKLYIIYSYSGRYIGYSDIPDFSSSEVVLNLIKAEKTYAIKIPKVVQDTAFGSGSHYFVCGYSKEGELWKIDMKTKTAKVIDLTKYGLNGEPEGLEEYEGNIIMSFSNRSVYKIKINE